MKKAKVENKTKTNNEKVKGKLTKKIWENKVQSLCKLLHEADNDFPKECAAEHACVEIAVWGGNGHYSTLGILEESKLILSWSTVHGESY
jgi:hypothetical protein